jgi:hypothetical protein
VVPCASVRGGVEDGEAAHSSSQVASQSTSVQQRSLISRPTSATAATAVNGVCVVLPCAMSRRRRRVGTCGCLVRGHRHQQHRLERYDASAQSLRSRRGSCDFRRRYGSCWRMCLSGLSIPLLPVATRTGTPPLQLACAERREYLVCRKQYTTTATFVVYLRISLRLLRGPLLSFLPMVASATLLPNSSCRGAPAVSAMCLPQGRWRMTGAMPARRSADHVSGSPSGGLCICVSGSPCSSQHLRHGSLSSSFRPGLAAGGGVAGSMASVCLIFPAQQLSWLWWFRVR